ncbi:MAG: glutaredoxin family protein [Bacteroidota bacterium]
MNRICPHCGHARENNASVPDWQCPKCEKAYSKAGASLPPDSFRQYGHPAAQQRQGRGGKWLLLLLVLAAAFWFGRPLLQQRGTGPGALASAASAQAATGESSSSQPEVHLYATDWCGYCKATRSFFLANGIRYVEHDIEKDSAALQTHRQLGGNGVPLVVIGDDVIKGYNEATMRDLLRPWLKG